MDAKEKYGYWLETAQYDLDTADAMYESGRWLYVVFMCQQAVEKLVKGLYILYVDDNVPRIHNIRNVISRFSSSLPEIIPETHYHLFDALTSFYMEGRYTEYKDNLSKLLSDKDAKALIAETKEVFAWLQTLIP